MHLIVLGFWYGICIILGTLYAMHIPVIVILLNIYYTPQLKSSMVRTFPLYFVFYTIRRIEMFFTAIFRKRICNGEDAALSETRINTAGCFVHAINSKQRKWSRM